MRNQFILKHKNSCWLICDSFYSKIGSITELKPVLTATVRIELKNCNPSLCGMIIIHVIWVAHDVNLF